MDEEAICPPMPVVMLYARDEILGFNPQDGHFKICDPCRELVQRLKSGDLHEDLVWKHPEVREGRAKVFHTDWGTIQ